MRHDNCGGRLKVIESVQFPIDGGIAIHRIRKCNKCNALINSQEAIYKALIDKDYKHRHYYVEKENRGEV